ncbi:23S rRNA (adenine(2030)-N(6))-methyltransferase RlmJ [Litoribrevibacter euphylliae]|uniref:Ribosomal RNA large subunit methyltransferase J n=1 Tax=Litoribrevibacter euphylliae TaxID=1834034 RepID=A0ABV7HD27_9GAMM
MLSYRHAFHAGNHADVLKHSILVSVLEYYLRKDKPFWYIDSHSGAGFYKLDSKFAAKNAEYKTGISKVLNKEGLPELLSSFQALVKEANAGKRSLTFYPGSPWFAAQMLRSSDKLRLHELHPSDAKLLQENMRNLVRKRAHIEVSDGFVGVKGVMPPPTKRAVVLIDPPYEDKKDYQKVAKLLKDSLLRFQNGTFAVWYPQLASIESREFPALLKKAVKQAGVESWCHATLSIKGMPKGKGMYGSGMFIVNPPYLLPEQLEKALPVMKELMCDPLSGDFSLEFEGL